MDISTGKTYATKEEALAAGVSEADLALLTDGIRGVPRPSFVKPASLRFSKGSFKRVPQAAGEPTNG